MHRQQAGEIRRKHGWASEHDPKKWTPVFRKDHAAPETWSDESIQFEIITR
jgi:hypothetical protein